MERTEKQLKVITHSGHFQPDDVFAIAALQLLLGDFELVRTRDPEVIKTGDWVVDVGREYDPEKMRLDHHQEGGAGKRENGIPYSSIGLVWKHYGAEICGSAEVAQKIDEKLIQALDATDNGVSFYEAKDVYPYLLDDALFSFNSTWKEGEHFDEGFIEAVGIAKRILVREIQRTKDAIEARDFVERAYMDTKDKRILIFDAPYPTNGFLETHSEILFIVKPEVDFSKWKVNAVRAEEHRFKNRKDLPAAWAGKEGEELQVITGVADAMFCHNGRFVAGAKTKEGAVALAKLAIES